MASYTNILFDETTGLLKAAATATALATARSINNVMFDGTQDITITAQRAVTFSFPGLEPIIGDVQTDGFFPTETPEFIGVL